MSNRIYETNITLTASMCDGNNNVRLSSIMENLVNLTGIQTDMWERECSFPIDKENIHWIINKYDVKIYSHPKYESTIKASTYQSRYTKHFCERVFTVKDSEDNLLMSVISYWSLRDFNAMKIVSVPEEYADFTYTDDSIEKTDKKMSKKVEYTNKSDLFIRRDDFDVNKHVNNAKYFAFMYECDDVIDYDNYDIEEILLSFSGGINEIRGNTMEYCASEADGVIKLNQKITCSDNTTAALIESYWRKK